METYEILEEIREIMKDFSIWNEKSYEALFNLEQFDVENETINSQYATPLLELLCNYSRIREMIIPDELFEVIEICQPKGEKYITEIDDILSLSEEFYDLVKTDFIAHPVLECIENRNECLNSEVCYFDKLDYYRRITSEEEADAIINATVNLSKVGVYQLERYFEFIVKEQVKNAIQNKNIERVLASLVSYSTIIESKNSSTDDMIIYIKSYLMSYLYENYAKNPQNIQEAYKELEYWYLYNYYYKQNAQISNIKILEYKQNM